MTNMVIIGDSFASWGSELSLFKDWKGPPDIIYSTLPGNSPAWTQLVADHYNSDLKLFGYVGKSWWFSYSQFEKWKHCFPIIWENTDVVIMIHTWHLRFNSSEVPVPGNIHDPASDNITDALKQYQVYLQDEDFDEWAQDQFFKSLPVVFNNKKLINMPVMPITAERKNYTEIAAGTTICDSLYNISLEEYKNNAKKFDLVDIRMCHLSPQNHVVLANELINIVDNYNPGPVSFRPNMFHKAFIQ